MMPNPSLRTARRVVAVPIQRLEQSSTKLARALKNAQPASSGWLTPPYAHHVRRHSNRPLAGDVAPDQSCSDRVVAPMTIVTVASGGLTQNRRWQ